MVRGTITESPPRVMVRIKWADGLGWGSMAGVGGNGRPLNLANCYSSFQFHQKYHNQGGLPYHRLDEYPSLGLAASCISLTGHTPYFSVTAFQSLFPLQGSKLCHSKMSLWNAGYFKQKTIKAQKTQEETLTFPLSCLKNYIRGSITVIELSPWITRTLTRHVDRQKLRRV